LSSKGPEQINSYRSWTDETWAGDEGNTEYTGPFLCSMLSAVELLCSHELPLPAGSIVSVN